VEWLNARTSAWKVLVHVDAAVDAADAEEEREETQPTSNVTTAAKWDTLPVRARTNEWKVRALPVANDAPPPAAESPTPLATTAARPAISLVIVRTSAWKGLALRVVVAEEEGAEVAVAAAVLPWKISFATSAARRDTLREIARRIR